ncbi:MULTISPECIES: spore maturation protein [Shouchella]|jgi:spore maturation protein B|uniref:Spore maturation protein n=1 Tax=Shouchella clausii TaxID=79880 RepID=A0A268RZI1_SHOCL|nr:MULTISPECIES: spore maturation protein [Shouchella]PAD42955.1 spore maturation protein [Bacillus sp. 7520-S]AST97944.1 spore maturation protein [Shouchella clausii]MBU8597140.1 spore maturation protein [Shouchella clausii]MCR1289299.1 spore maturation protein [Shouchella clausii]MCY1104333.1 spore maturation protein [Shouchella clausii]
MTYLTSLSVWLIPLLIGFVVLVASFKRVPTYETFVSGAKEGFSMAVSIIPYLVGMLVAIYVFRASGAMDALVGAMAPVLSWVGIPADIVPLALMRPISGTGALGLMTDLTAVHGPDSYIGRLAATLQGSTDTTFYILTVYFGAVGIKKMGDALKVGLLADLVGMIAAVVVVSLVFG